MFSRIQLWLSLALFSIAAPLSAQVTVTWVGSANATENIALTTNWALGASPAGNDLVFTIAISSTVDLAAHLNVHSLTFTGAYPHYYFTTGNARMLGITSGITVAATGAGIVDLTYGLNLFLLNNQTWETNGNLSVYGNIEGFEGSPYSLTKTGFGTLTLGGASTFAGGLTSQYGELVLASSSNTGGSFTNGPVGTGTLTLWGGSDVRPASEGTPITLRNAISLVPNEDHYVHVDDDERSLSMILTGVISGAGGIDWCTLGTLTLTNSGNTFSYGVDMRAGTVLVGASSTGHDSLSGVVTDNGPLGTGTLTLWDNTTLGVLSDSGAQTLHNRIYIPGGYGLATFDTSGGDLTLLGEISTGYYTAIHKTGAGSLTLGGASSFSGAFTLLDGSLYVGSSSYYDPEMEEDFGPLGQSDLTMASGTTLAAVFGGQEIWNNVNIANSVTFGFEDSDTLTLSGRLRLDSTSVTVNLGSGSQTNLRGGISTGVESEANINSALTFRGAGFVLIDGSSNDASTSSHVTSITSDGAGVIFVQPSDLPGDSIGAINGGYIGMADGFTDSPSTLIDLVTLPASFAGIIGFDSDPDVEGVNEFTGTINLSGFTNAGFGGIGTLTNALISSEATLFAPTTGILPMFVHDGESTLTVNAALLGAHNVNTVVIGRLGNEEDGTVILGGTSDYTGGTLYRSGRLLVSNGYALGSGPLTIEAGAVSSVLGGYGPEDLTLPNAIVLGNATHLTIGNADNLDLGLTLSGIVSGTGGSLTVMDGATLTLLGNNTFGGGLNVGDDSTAHIESNTGAGSGELAVNGGQVVFYSDRPVIGGLSGSAGEVVLNGHESGGDSLVTTLVVNQSQNTTYGGVLRGDFEYGTGNLEKQGSGTLTLTGSNSYDGTTTILGGTLSVSSLGNGGSNSGIGRSSSSAANLVLNGGGLRYNGGGGSTDRLLSLGANGGTLSSSGAGAISFTNAGAVALSGTNTARTFTLSGSNTGNNQFAPILGNNGTGRTSLIKEGTGTWMLTGANTYTGSTWIQGGKLKIGATSLSNLSALIVDSGAFLESHDVSFSVGSIAGAGNINMAGPSSGTVSLTTGADNTSTTFSGVITEQDHPNSVGLVKTGTGTLTLTGANVYGGGTTVTGGMIILGNNSALGSGSITLNGGGISAGNGVTLTNPLIFTGIATVLSGNGTIGTAIIADNHVVLSPGNSPGNLTFSAGLTLASGTAISFQIQNAAGTAGVGYDLITVTGGVLNLTAAANTITFNLSTLDGTGNAGLAQNFNPATSYSWTFATSPNANITGFNANQFNLVNGFANNFGGGSFSFSQSLDQRSLLLNFAPVPEPSTWFLLGSGLGALALKLRRRK